MNKDNSRKGQGSNLGYYCGAKFDTIPTSSILPSLPNHWKLSESKSTPSSPVPTSVFETNVRHSSGGSSVPTASGRNTAPVLKAASLPSPTGHDINASYTKMVRSGENIGNPKNSEIRDKREKPKIVYSEKGQKKGGRGQKKPKERTIPVTPASCTNGAPAPTTTEASSKEGHILMAMLQSGRVRTESTKTEVSPHLTPVESLNVQSSPVKFTSVETIIKLNSELSISSNPKQQRILYNGMNGSCQQKHADSSEHLKALLKVCS